jgi:glycosyltransferase involved in cell wall biosynthesis
MMESWACGTPVVATRHGGLPEYFAAGTGYLFDPKTDQQEARNPEGLAEALHQAIRLSATEGIREVCRKHASRFSAETLGPQIEKLYKA